MQIDKKKYYTVNEASRSSGLTRQAIAGYCERRGIHEGVIVQLKVKKHFYIPKDSPYLKGRKR